MKNLDLDFEHYNALIDSLPVVIILMNTNREIVYMNDISKITFDTTTEEEVGVNFFDKFMNKVDSEYIKLAMKHFSGRGDIDQLKTKDGYQYFKWYDVKIPDKNGKDLLFFAAHNVDDLVKRDLELISIFNAFSDLYFWLNYGGLITRCETGIVNELYVEKNQFVGKTIQSLVPTCVAKLFNNAIQNTITTGKITRIEYELTVPSDKKYFEARLSLIDEKNIMCIIRDITDKVISDRNITTLVNKLPQEQKLEVVELLTKGVAHDFNNIFYIIMVAIENIIDKCTKSDCNCCNSKDPDLQEVCDIKKLYSTIYNSIKRGSSLIKDLLSFSRTSPMHIDKVSLNHAIGFFIKNNEKTFPKNIKFVTEYDQGLRNINADKEQITQIITNLCNNSKEAMPDGGTITIKTENKFLEVNDLKNYQLFNPNLNPGEYACLIISDTGLGIDPTMITKIFTPFFSTKETQNGTGLGLSIVYKIVQQYNGIITCHSIPNKSTTFTICLPSNEFKDIGKETIHAQLYSKYNNQILIIDDEEIITSITKEFLEDLDYPTIIATTGEIGLDVVSENINTIDIVILDLTLSKSNNKKYIDDLLKINPNLSFIISTGNLTPIDDIKHHKNIKSILYKPYTMNTLTSVIDKIRSKETHENCRHNS